MSDKEENGSATFARLDVDKVKSVAQACGITAMPTFKFFAAGAEVDTLKGADPHALSTKIKQHVSDRTKTSGFSSLVRGMMSLNDKVDIKQLEMLNATETSSVRHLLDPTSKSSVESDSDEQLMLYIPFQESSKVHSLVIRVNPEKKENAPSAMRIFVNRPNILSFEDVDSIPATQVISTQEIQYDANGECLIALRYVKFQKVNSLVIFIEQNKGEEDCTMLRNLEFLGTVEATNSSGVVKKMEHDHD